MLKSEMLLTLQQFVYLIPNQRELTNAKKGDILQKILLIDPEKCTGCRTCEVACSFHHERACNPAKARIHVLRWEEDGVDVPMVCQQCEEPICVKVCPVKCISRDNSTGAVLIDHDACIGCRMCMIACPLGGISLDVEKRKMIKCDLCGGNPECTKYCSAGAIKYTTASRATMMKKRASAQKLGELIRKLSSTPEP